MGQRNETFIFLACREHKTHTKKIFHWLHFFFTWLFLYHKEVSRVFSSTSNIAWQFSYQWHRQRAILLQTQIHMYANLVEQNLILTLSCSLCLRLLQVFLSSWCSEWKVQLYFSRDFALNFLCGQELCEQFLCDLSAKEIRLSVVEFNRKYMKLTKFFSDLSA